MAKVEIKNRWNGAILYTADVPDDLESGMHMRVALEQAVEARAYLAGANLAGAKWRDGIVINKSPIRLYGLFWSVTILDAHMQIGCELHSLADWQSFGDDRICRMSGKEALRFWRAHKESLLTLARSADRSFEPVKTDAKVE